MADTDADSLKEGRVISNPGRVAEAAGVRTWWLHARPPDQLIASLRAVAFKVHATHDELIMAIKNVLSGKSYLSPGISETVLEGYLEGRKTVKHQTSWETLTHREREILKLIAEGYRNKQIAKDLCISVKTVEKHRANLMEKLDLHNVQALTALAIEKGLVSHE